MSPNNADGMANSVDPDQTAPLVAVWSGSALFAQISVWKLRIITVIEASLLFIKEKRKKCASVVYLAKKV